MAKAKKKRKQARQAAFRAQLDADIAAAAGVPRIKLTPEAAVYLGTKPNFLEKARVEGTGPAFIRLGSRKVGYAIEDLDAWIASRRRTSTSDIRANGR